MIKYDYDKLLNFYVDDGEFQDHVEEVICESVPDRPLGDLRLIHGCIDEMIEEAKRRVNKEYAGENVPQAVFESLDMEYRDIPLASIVVDLVEQQRSDENYCIQGGGLAICMMTDFLRQGSWQHGVQLPSGEVVRETGGLALKDGAWQLNGESVVPIIWFGLDGEAPIEVWTLSRSPRLLRSDRYDGRAAWLDFWFNDDYCMDWDAMFDGFHSDTCNYFTIWMFCECGMSEPKEDFFNVRDSCPINLCVNDTNQQFTEKIDAYFLNLLKIQS